MRPELEILDYLEGSEQTLDELQLACPDRDTLLLVVRRLFHDGWIYIRIGEDDAWRDAKDHEIRAWAWDPPRPERMSKIRLGLTERGLARQ